jgi:hypothetical protein
MNQLQRDTFSWSELGEGDFGTNMERGALAVLSLLDRQRS